MSPEVSTLIYIKACCVGCTAYFAKRQMHELPTQMWMQSYHGCSLSVCTKHEEHTLIWLLWVDDAPGAEIHNRLSAQHGYRALPKQSMHKCMMMIKNNHTGIPDEEQSELSLTSTTDEYIQWVHSMIPDNLQSWFYSWNHPRLTWVSSSLCKIGSKTTHNRAPMQTFYNLPRPIEPLL